MSDRLRVLLVEGNLLDAELDGGIQAARQIFQTLERWLLPP